MILVTGIILTCSGGTSLLSVLNSLAISSATSEILSIMGVNIPLVTVSIWSIIMAVATLCFGITGIIWSGKVEKARNVIIMGIILIGFQIVSLIINLIVYVPMFGADAFSSIFSLFDDTSMVTDTVTGVVSSAMSSIIRVSIIVGAVIGCILPTLYIIGGNRLRKNIG